MYIHTLYTCTYRGPHPMIGSNEVSGVKRDNDSPFTITLSIQPEKKDV